MAQIPGGYLVLIRKIPYGGRKIPRSSEEDGEITGPSSSTIRKYHIGKYLADIATWNQQSTVEILPNDTLAYKP